MSPDRRETRLNNIENAGLVWNTTEWEHHAELLQRFENATFFQCAVAFVKMSGLKEIKESVEALLNRGGKARFIVGLDFYQTDPEVLDLLAQWQQKFGVGAYVAEPNRGYCFHPKIYIFSYANHASVMVGSANLTAGGLGNNWEASFRLDQPLPSASGKLLDQLIANEEVVPLTKAIIDTYRKRHRIAAALSALQKRELNKLTAGEGDGIGVLDRIAAYLKADPEQGLAHMSSWRAGNVEAAQAAMAAIRTDRPDTPERLEPYLKTLRKCMSASLLQLYIARIARTPARFVDLLDEAARLKSEAVPPDQAYGYLRPIAKEISGLGPNWLTEILHASDPDKYAILNGASVAGMALAGFEFPAKPSKSNITSAVYGEFCLQAEYLVGKLKLQNMSELDAVFGYAYFNDEPPADD